MRHFTLSFLAAFALLSCQAAPVRDAELTAACDELAAEHDLSGVVLLAVGDEVLVERAYGLRDVQAQEQVDVDTRFLVASLTKPVIGLLSMRLVEAGRIALDDEACAHCAELAGTEAGRATVHQLLTQTSGLPHYEGWPGFLDDTSIERSQGELLALLAETELRSEPGASFHYSGPGYLLLGIVLERATGTPLEQLLQEWVFEPLEMHDSQLITAETDASMHACLYERTGDGLAPAPPRHASTLRATGGLMTTARDLHRFVRAVQRGALLREETRATLLTGGRGRYACGLIVYRNPWTGPRFARHKGSMPGVSAHFVFGLDDERAAIVLCNVGRTRVEAISDALMARCPRELPAAASAP